MVPLLDNPACYAAILALLTDIINGDIDPTAAPLLLSSRLIPATKPNGGIRPIAVGEVFMRLAGLVAITHIADVITKIFGNVQLGCGAPGGSQAAAITVQTALSAGLAALTIDIANAFNTRSRLKIIQQLHSYTDLSPIYRIAHLALSHASPLLLAHSDDEMLSTNGVRQGCTLAGLLFALSIHSHLVNVRPDVVVCAIQDDISLCGEPDTMISAAAELKTALTEHNDLKLNADKEEVLWAGDPERVPIPLTTYAATQGCRLVLTAATSQSCARLAQELGINTVTNETTLLGVPIGHNAPARAQARITRNHALFRALDNDRLSTQSATLLLRLIANSFGTYLARTMNPSDSLLALTYLDDFVQSRTAKRIQLAPFEANNELVTSQMRLKLSLGGLGLQSATDIRHVAFWAGVAQAAPLLRHDTIINVLHQSSWLTAALEECWSSPAFLALRTRDTNVAQILPTTPDVEEFASFYATPSRPRHQRHRPIALPPVPAADPGDNDRIPAEKLQRSLSTRLSTLHSKDLFNQLPTEGRTRLMSLRGPGAVLWLSTCPTSKVCTFDNVDFSTLIRLRLGLNPTPEAPPTCSCQAAPALSAAPSHTLSCQHLRDNGIDQFLTERHDYIKEHLVNLLREAGHHVTAEPSGLDPHSRQRPDISVTDMRGRYFLLDVTVVNPTADSRSANMNESEADAVNQKIRKYALLAQQERAHLIPLVFNAYGHWHQLVADLLASSDDSPVPAFRAISQNTQLHPQQWAITKLLSAAGVGVIEEPGPLNDKDVGDARAPKPDQLLSFVSLGASSAVSRVCTDVTVIECNAISKIKAKTSAVSSLNAKAYEKRTKHHDAARRAGVEFVPLVASSLGSLHESFAQFLQLEGMRLDDERLFVLFGGRRAFKTRLTDSVSCAIARGTGYVACVAAERLIYATTGHHSQVMPDVQQLNRRPRFKAKAVLRSERRQSDVARGAGPATRPESYGPEDA
jgi:hypothetical protein